MKKLVILGLVLLVMPEGYEHRNIPLRLTHNGKLKRQQNSEKLNYLLEDAIQSSWSLLKRTPGVSSDDDDDDIDASQEEPVPPHSHEHGDLPTPPAPPEPPHSHEHGRHILDHIRDEIHEGHVTQDKMSHWWREIQAALNDGSLTMDEVSHLMQSLEHTNSLHGHHDENCCWFG